ncbi:uncharacterized protein N7498_007298 [Penicillium cinerascens]|uniref:Uncharacterized protein n=1 Tax=Penicillium cinerascens TaxID=70096 RepID=A0A9W9JPY7_9EURO|nr:uncharacterized protein N7498_007298 [Penicillium cinerascens]KAJ5198181.1 hypothetical protein N7498_007298 [Penicillium cinerascens]
MPVVLARTLPRKTLHSGRIVHRRIEALARPVVSTIAVEDGEADVGVVHVAGWDCFAEEAQVPLLKRKSGVTYASICEDFPGVEAWEGGGC